MEERMPNTCICRCRCCGLMPRNHHDRDVVHRGSDIRRHHLAVLAIGPILIIPYKRSKPRGFFSHLLYVLGWSRFAGYPPFTVSRFFE